jgi:hypothetical protein
MLYHSIEYQLDSVSVACRKKDRRGQIVIQHYQGLKSASLFCAKPLGKLEMCRIEIALCVIGKEAIGQ